MAFFKKIRQYFSDESISQRKMTVIRHDFEAWMKKKQPLVIHILSFDPSTKLYHDETVNRYWLGFMGARGIA
jgi:hypothetical protein